MLNNKITHQVIICAILFMMTACSEKPLTAEEKEQQQLMTQEQQQGYPVLIATPVVADYQLPFCEKKYCIEIELQSFKSHDTWFNQYTDGQIADIIRQALQIKQKLTLQEAVNAFVAQSDAWQQAHPDSSAWSLYIRPRVVVQNGEIAILQMTVNIKMADLTVPEYQRFYVVDRKQQKTVSLFDVIVPQYRLALNDYIQQQYKLWQKQIPLSQQQKMPQKLYWASQDWYFDDQGLAIYYSSRDLSLTQAKDLTIFLSPEQSRQWLKPEYRRILP